MAQKEAYSTLVHGVKELTFKGPPVPSKLQLNGHHAFPLAVNTQDQVIIAASCYGLGRIVVMGHETYLQDFPDLVKNALGWLQSPSGRSKVGIHTSCQAIVGNLSSSFQAEVCQFRSDLGVYVSDAYSVGPFAEEMVRFLKEGGGILLAGQAWHWHQVYPQENLQHHFPGNKVSGVAGIYVTEHYGPHESVTVPSQLPSDWSATALEGAYSTLMDGIKELTFKEPPVPSELLLNGHLAFPLAVNTQDQVIIAASCYGLGRIVVMGHEAYLCDFPDLMKNALGWLQSPSGRNKVGVHPSCQAIMGNLSSFQAEVCQLRSDLGVYITDAYRVGPFTKELVNFLKEGGGILIAGQAWHWHQVNPSKNVLLNFPGNKVCSVAGIYFSEHHGPHGETRVSPKIPLKWCSKSVKEYFKEDLELLLDGVSEFDIRGSAVPSEVLIHGLLSFPIGTTPDGKAFLAGAYYGLGRVIVATQEAYLSHEPLSCFLRNAVLWLDKGRKGLVGVSPKLARATPYLSRSGMQCQVTDFKDNISVYVCTSYSNDHCNEIQRFVAEGGGLLIGGHAWYWGYSNTGEKALMKYPGNHILNQMGLSLLTSTVEQGVYKAKSGQELLEVYQFRQFLPRVVDYFVQSQSLTDDQQECLKKMGKDCADYLTMAAHNCASYSSVLERLTKVVKTGKVPQVCETCPVSSGEDRLLLDVASEVCKVCPDPEALVPYIIKDVPHLQTVRDTRVPINASTAGREEWISTGLYLCPGMTTNIKFPSNLVDKGWKVQIGCQSDNIRHLDVLKRAPVVCERFPVDSDVVHVWNLWGGLIYLIAPPNCQVEGVEIVVQKAVQAPYYKSGETTVYQWLQGIRNYPAPWAEMEFENLIITLHSEFIRNLERPDLVAAQWDAVMRGIADLAAKPAKFPRKERFVADVQISAGFMHAGYPVMIHTSSAPDLLRLANKKDPWGPIHELGHNQQLDVWEFKSHTGEATNNLWSVFICETVYGLEWGQAHPQLTRSNRLQQIKKYINGGRKLEDWRVWTALETYLQLQERFGWDAWKKFFGSYHNMHAVPRDQQGKMNTFVETFSTVVKQNLTSFFKSWGWPVEATTEEKLSGLPDWRDHPMA